MVRISNLIRYANIPHKLLKQHLTELISNGLIEFQEEQRTYKTGYRGLYFINKCNQMNELMTILIAKVSVLT